MATMLNSLFQKTKKLKRITPYLPIPLIIIGAILLVSVASPPPHQHTISNYGEFDLREIDTENYVISMGGVVEYIPNKLLNPDEFSSWASRNEAFFGGVGGYSFVTSRIRIYVEDGKWYTFSRYSIDYSHRLFVNGQWLLDIGRPGETSETDIPNTGRITFTAQGVDGVIEIVQQSSNHVHRSGGGHLWWFVGTGTMLSDWARAEQYQTNIILGSFMVLALLFLVLFFTHGRNYANLLFSIFCFAWFMRMGVTGGRVFTVIVPWLTWVWKFRIEYLAIPISAMLTLAIVNIIFKDALHKWVLKILYYISAVFILLFLTLDTVAMRGWLDIAFVIYFAAILWLLGCLIKFGQKGYNTEQKMFAVGLFLFIVAAIVDFGYVSAFFHMPNFHMTGVAVLVFALCEAVAVFTSTMNQLEEAKKNELEAIVKGQTLAAENAALDILFRSKSEFLEKVSHEMKTPLMVMGGYAQTTERHIDENAVSDKTRFYLQTIFLESQRLSDLVTEMLKTSIAGGHKTDMQTSVADIINKAAAMCQPILDMNKNRLAINIETNCPDVKANPDMIIQIFFNLVGNANRHMKSDTIHISAKREGRVVLFAVRDNGKGISPELLPSVFERGISGDDGTGLGLHICKETVEAHGGVIAAENAKLGGAIISFTLPIYNEAEETT